ncbi:alpha/beta fold hydrolase [Colwellia hornerae]|uniref:Alpha/beta hydrolase n=1 Tax=Colwellia hornerae TaxID=89402 RepID=A0A5C6Q2F7_9GAMM|nr:alpha/beta hydrolase [Colwellia hornerae]TWX46202.1 alpha/beta hydrolase [Colwellia hornerae]TWX53902.1 alpha/beta hydrolase [Colwellia hornerae]TWX63021.1 alpha/beta hydrolase [Colwellia hornerae]
MFLSEDVLLRNNVKVIGKGEKTLFLAHGFGCDQNMWRFLTPKLLSKFTLVLFDYVGSGASDISQYNKKRYSELAGYAEDIIEICAALKLSNVTFIGHSVSSIIGAIAANQQPNLFAKLIMVCPSPCFLNFPPEYMGGFEKVDLLELLGLMDKNYIGWADYLAPLVIGNANSTDFVGELSGSFCSTDPVIAKNFAQATFLSDYRHILKDIKQPSLIFQSKNDALAATSVGEFIHSQISESQLEVIEADGHCLHMTHPNEIVDTIIEYANRDH